MPIFKIFNFDDIRFVSYYILLLKLDFMILILRQIL